MKKIFLLSLPCLFLSLASLQGSESAVSYEKEICSFFKDIGTPEEASFFMFSPSKREKEVHRGRKFNWATYKQTYGTENIQIKFPGKPSITQEKCAAYIRSSGKEGTYTFVAGIPPVGGIKPKEAFSIAIASLCHQPKQLAEYHIAYGDVYNTLDVVSNDSKDGTVTKYRMIITPRNYYILYTTHNNGEKEFHSYFVDSFRITY